MNDADSLRRERARAFLLAMVARDLGDLGVSPEAVAERMRAVPGPERMSGDFRCVPCRLERVLTDTSVQLNATDGEVMGWYLDAAAFLGAAEVSEEACLAAATRAADPPGDASLARSGSEEQGGGVVFVAEWEHRHEGLLVEGDHIAAVVNARTGQVFCLSRKWHAVNPAATVR